MKIKLITLLTGLSALLIAACAAYFSVTGLGLLFSGATIQVIIMATSLEIGKLVGASYLHNYWTVTNSAMKTYMIIGIITLITITSAGIFGFLSNAYTQTQISVNQVESKIELFESQKERVLSDIPRWEARIGTLSENRTRQEVRYDSLVAGENWVNARRTTDLINEANVEITALNNSIDISRAKADSLDQLIFATKTENIDVEREIGGFRFVAAAFDTNTDSVVKWFIILLIFVFDPMAVIMVLAFNNALAVDRGNAILSTVKQNKENDLYEVYGEEAIEYPELPPGFSLNTDHIDMNVHDTVIEEITNRDDYDEHVGTNNDISGLKIKTSGGHIILKPKYKTELETKGIVYEEIKK